MSGSKLLRTGSPNILEEIPVNLLLTECIDSVEVVGTGSPQDVHHSLGEYPKMCLLYPPDSGTACRINSVDEEDPWDVNVTIDAGKTCILVVASEIFCIPPLTRKDQISFYNHIDSGHNSVTITHGLGIAPTQANGFVIKIFPDGRDAMGDLETVAPENIGATTFDVALSEGLTVEEDRYFTAIVEKVGIE
jgi:hypothetical protein